MWHPHGKDRWTWTADDDRHLLLAADGLLAELHCAYVHLYRPPAEGPEAQPLDGAWHIRTMQLAQAPATDDDGWTMLADIAHATANADATARRTP